MKQIKLSVKSRTAKIALYIYAIWFAVNLFALAFGLSHPAKGIGWRGSGHGHGGHYYEYENTSAFYPFGSQSLNTYDCSEFVAYTIAIPIIVFAIYRIYRLVVNHPK